MENRKIFFLYPLSFLYNHFAQIQKNLYFFFFFTIRVQVFFYAVLHKTSYKFQVMRICHCERKFILSSLGLRSTALVVSQYFYNLANTERPYLLKFISLIKCFCSSKRKEKNEIENFNIELAQIMEQNIQCCCQ